MFGKSLNINFFILGALLVLANCTHVFAQDTAKVKPSVLRFTFDEVLRSIPARLNDTTSDYLERYHPVKSKFLAYNELGNIGLPARSLELNGIRSFGFNYGFVPHEVYFIDPEKTNFINTKSPYTDAFYAQGSNELLMLNIIHSQNILPRWNIGIEFRRTTSEGFLLNQYSSLYGIHTFSSYHSKNKRYYVLASLTSNFGLNEESGGILSDTSFESLTGNNRRVYTRLENTETHYHNRTALVNQFFRFGNPKRIYKDKDTIYDFIPAPLVHTLKASEVSYGLTSNNEGDITLMPHQYYDIGATTYDSFYFGKLSNKLAYEHLWLTKNRFKGRWSVGIQHELIQVAQPVFVRRFQNSGVQARYEVFDPRVYQPKFLVSFDYMAYGYNAKDFLFTSLYRFQLGGVFITPTLRAQREQVDYFFQRFRSNAFIWTNTFDPLLLTEAGLEIKTHSWRNNLILTGKVQKMMNWISMNQDGPFQIGNVRVVTLGLEKKFQLGKFHFEHQLLYQKVSTSLIRIPELSGRVRYYFQSKLFGISRLQVGFNIYYMSAFKGDGYNPATRSFFIQNDVVFGNYPVVSPFLVMDIKRASLFLVYDHLNMGLQKTGMYYAAHYPMDLSAMRMGIRWRFYD